MPRWSFRILWLFAAVGLNAVGGETPQDVILDAKENWRNLPPQIVILGGCSIGGVHGICRINFPSGKWDFLATEFCSIWDIAPADRIALVFHFIGGQTGDRLALLDVDKGTVTPLSYALDSRKSLVCGCFGPTSSEVFLVSGDPSSGVWSLEHHLNRNILKKDIPQEIGRPLDIRWTEQGMLARTERGVFLVTEVGVHKFGLGTGDYTFNAIAYDSETESVVISWRKRVGLFASLRYGITFFTRQGLTSFNPKMTLSPEEFPGTIGSLVLDKTGEYILFTASDKGPTSLGVINCNHSTTFRLATILGGKLGIGTFPEPPGYSTESSPLH